MAKVKPVQELKIVGQSPQRYDIPAKVDGSLKWAVDVKLPGHGACAQREAAGGGREAGQHRRVVRARAPRVRQGGQQGQLRRGGLRAGRAGDQGGPAAQGELAEAGHGALPGVGRPVHVHAQRRRPPPSAKPDVVGNPDAALAGAAKVVEAEYDVPFQGHTAFAPAHAMADPSNGQMTIYSNDMKSYGMRNGVAEFLGMPREQVRVVWMEGPQGYGRTAADDAGFEAAYLAKEIGRPVRVQWMRHEETAWDTKGPAFTFKLRGGLDAQGNLVALDYDAQAADYNHVGYNEPDTVLIAQLMGIRRDRPSRGGSAATPSDMYAIPNRRMAAPGGEPAAGLGDAGSHRQPARSQRSAGRPSPPNRSSTSWRPRPTPTRSSSA